MTSKHKRQREARKLLKQLAYENRKPLKLFKAPNSTTRVWCNDIAPRRVMQTLSQHFMMAGCRYNLEYRLTETTMHPNGRNIVTAWTTLDDLVAVTNFKLEQYHNNLNFATKATAERLEEMCYKVAKELRVELMKEVK